MKSLIKLAENPVDSEDEEKEDKMANTRTNKGRSVSGPRTKLMNADDRFDRIEKSIVSLARMVKHLAEGDEEPMDDYAENEDPMAVDDIDGDDEDELELNLSDDEYFGSDFEPYGGELDRPERGGEETEQDEPEDIPGVSHEGDLSKGRVNRSRVNRSRVSKDDASSNFGEKDNDIPGNRPLEPDKKDKEAGEYLIQGGPGDGPGPISKGQARAIAQIVRGELAKAGVGPSAVAKSSDGPRIGTRGSKIDKGDAVDMDALREQARGMSFSELNRIRVGVGDLPLYPGA